jgi:hypothetical protein
VELTGIETAPDEPPPPEKKARSSIGAPGVAPEPSPVQTPTAEPEQPEPSAQPKDESRDPIEADLERRIVEAELAGRSTVADVLARRLEAHRKATAAGNVLAFPVPQKRQVRR